jgi:hypothetical protein
MSFFRNDDDVQVIQLVCLMITFTGEA